MKTIISFLFLILTQCSTLVRVSSEPEGAVVFYEGQRQCRTPCRFEASNLAWKQHHVTMRTDAGKKFDYTLKKEVKGAGVFWGFFTAMIGWFYAYGPQENQHFDLE